MVDFLQHTICGIDSFPTRYNIDVLQVSEHFSIISYKVKSSRMQLLSPHVLSNLGFLTLVLHNLAPITSLHIKLI